MSTAFFNLSSKKIWGAVGAIFLVVSLGYSGYRYFLAPMTPQKATFYDRQNQPQMLENFRGKPLLVQLWAPWCGYCVRGLPSLDHITPRIQARGGDVIAVMVHPMVGKAVATFVRRNVKHLDVYYDPLRELPRYFEHTGTIPVTFFINAEGKEVFRWSGSVPWHTKEGAALINRHLDLGL